MRSVETQVAATAMLGTLNVLVAAPVAAKTAKECNDEYVERKGVIEAAKESKSDFMAACRNLGQGEPTPIAASTPPAARE